MAARPTFANEDWLVIMTSDHGGLGTDHSGGLPEQRTIPFIVAGPLATTVLPQANPRQVDVAATVLNLFRRTDSQQLRWPRGRTHASGPAPATLGQNLVFNGDAEYNRGFNSNSTQQYAAGWDDPGPGGITLVNYLAGNGFPSPADPGPANRGNNFFSGGTNAVSTMTQRIDVSNLASAIDSGNLDFNLSAWLGGYSSQNDTASVIAHFLNASNSEIGTAQLAAVTATERGNVTKLLFRERLGDVPASTRSINIELIATRSTGENDGYADNISFILGLMGDLNFDAAINVADWILFRSGQQVNMTGLTRGQALALGDLNGDFHNDHADFVLFKSAFDSANGAGSFAAMLGDGSGTCHHTVGCYLAVLPWPAKRVGESATALRMNAGPCEFSRARSKRPAARTAEPKRQPGCAFFPYRMTPARFTMNRRKSQHKLLTGKAGHGVSTDWRSTGSRRTASAVGRRAGADDRRSQRTRSARPSPRCWAARSKGTPACWPCSMATSP